MNTMKDKTPPFDEKSHAAKASANVTVLVTGDPRETDPVERTAYEIYCVCSDVKSLIDKFDTENGIEAFFTQKAVDDLNLASVRLASIVATLSTRKLVN